MWSLELPVLVVLIFLAAPAVSSVRRIGLKVSPERLENRLELTIKVASQHYFGDPTQDEKEASEIRLGFARIKLQLFIKNITDTPRLLCRVCVRDDGPLILPVIADGRPGNPLYVPLVDVMPGPYELPDFSLGRRANFVVIGPGETFEMKIGTTVPVAFATVQPRFKGYVLPGKYFLRGRFSTWQPVSQDMTETFRRRWQSSGDLIVEYLESVPIPIEIGFPRVIPNCTFK